MLYIIYFPEEKQVIACDPDDFSAPDVNLADFDALEGKLVRGVCIYEEKPYTNAVLLQVCRYRLLSFDDGNLP